MRHESRGLRAPVIRDERIPDQAGLRARGRRRRRGSGTGVGPRPERCLGLAAAPRRGARAGGLGGCVSAGDLELRPLRSDSGAFTAGLRGDGVGDGPIGSSRVHELRRRSSGV